MNSHCDCDDANRVSDGVLEEYALGRLDEELSGELKAHLRRCEACKARYEAARREVADLGKLLEGGIAEPEGVCLDDETLAMYLDQALEEGDRNEAEKHLSGCRPCRDRLVRIYRDLQEVVRSEVAMTEESEEPPEQKASVSEGDQITPQGPVYFSLVSSPRHIVARAVLPAGLGIAALAGAAVLRGRAALPLQFLALGCIGLALVETRASHKTFGSLGRRRLGRTLLAVLAVALFGLSILSPKGAGWYLTGAAACCLPLLLGRAETTSAPGRMAKTRPSVSETGAPVQESAQLVSSRRAEKRKR